MYTKVHVFSMVFLALLSIKCTGQSTDIGKKDDPVVGPFSEKLSDFLGEDICQLMLSAERVEAYLLKEWASDTTSTGFHSFRVIEKKDTLGRDHLDSLLTIISDEGSYQIDEIGKKCEFGPNLGFRFIGGRGEEFSLLVSLNCDVLKYMAPGEPVRMEDCDPAHMAFEKIGRQIFLDQFDQTFNDLRYVNSSNVDLSPAESSMPVDSSMQQQAPVTDPIPTQQPSDDSSSGN